MRRRPRTHRLPAAERKQLIVREALPLFARRGYNGVTTREIAEHAHCHEAILFRHFPTKEDLYWEVIDGKTRMLAPRSKLESRLRTQAGDRAVFTAIAEDILRRYERDPNLNRLLLFSALENHRLSHRFFRTYVEDFFEVLARHIQRRIRRGGFRRVDPLVAARGFVGMFFYHFMLHELFGGKRKRRLRPRQVAAMLSDIWLRGMANGSSSTNGRHASAPPRRTSKRKTTA
jgi:TetR/AcrR family transcriptional regulator